MKNHFFYQNHKICKKFGQHFLHNINIINSIIHFISPKKHESIIEIGPGLGAITIPISQYGNHIIAIEIDKTLVQKLTKNFSNQKKIKILQHNILSIDLQNLNIKKPIRIFGNLPYNISTPIIFHLFNYINLIQDMHFVLQREIVNRLIANPNNKKYGRLSVMVQYFCKIFRLLEIPSHSFTPAPKVHSTLIKLIPHTKKPYTANNVNKLSIIVKTAFSQRRKMIKNSLKFLLSVKQIEKQNINPELRAENLNIKQYCQLSNAL
ncbi:16S rRNA (adenine(1518)-N(6)/adenine(1519)-N(6))-dimethyltransferase RsmA [Blochmannia endosymbiont of Camponotus (Colobopsis) obliquus]|uniref:16S rRNA (adenine(1518)-N(6)/adenine(1519)-N(6))- dimethyltransferase RsmA n=1 Tax=Blochmannia endosymbiont of Camponotus (Colobopsis) obliquus TaxID=1505597 RepID=UPI00061A749E|nr:16S rRNA (adenine(1518)-N(6)/adenine(1519)-N(6))-dimethyltransferase RsmA [Blochmannia endosymbiont of Camponotus (Colobopsis) obliquus]AKC60302.1 Ribosomal RNA small subunit methyltransferase A [Blochmannia endosymbiont of Camponotus (Colobopsis) obliquus]